MESSYRVAGIDVHKSMLAVVVSDVAAEGEPRRIESLSLRAVHKTLEYDGPVLNAPQRAWSD
jgi:hypothetical protein